MTIRPGVRLILTATLFFSFMQLGVKTLNRLPPEEIVFFRALVALVISYVMIRRKGLPLFGNNKPLLLARGLSGAIALFLFFYSLQHLPLATAVTLQYLSPVFTIFFAMFIMKENTSLRQWLAFGVALGGVVLIRGFDTSVSIVDMSIGIISAMFSGLAYNFIRKLKDYDDPLTVVFYFPLVSIPVVLPFLFNTWIWPTAIEWATLIMVGVFTQVAQISMTKAYQLEKASDITIYKYTGIIFAISYGILFFDEIPTLMSVLGMAIVVTGVYLGSRQSRKIRFRDTGSHGPFNR